MVVPEEAKAWTAGMSSIVVVTRTMAAAVVAFMVLLLLRLWFGLLLLRSWSTNINIYQEDYGAGGGARGSGKSACDAELCFGGNHVRDRHQIFILSVIRHLFLARRIKSTWMLDVGALHALC